MVLLQETRTNKVLMNENEIANIVVTNKELHSFGVSDNCVAISINSSPILKHRLTFKTKLFYSFGHIYNDLSVSMWFAYTLLFFKFQFSDGLAGALLLIGQVADAVFSPVVGIASDKNPNWFVCQYGRRKSWHLLGVVMTTLSVPFTYNVCLGCQNSSTALRFAYYAFFVTIFQCGWAATQVAHVTMITDLTDDTNERLALNAYRQAATVASNVCMYTITLFVLGFGDSGTITERDLPVFTKVAYIVCSIGIVFSVLFHIFVKEPQHNTKKMKPKVFTVERDMLIEQNCGSTNTITLLAMRSIDELELTQSTVTSNTSDYSNFSHNSKSIIVDHNLKEKHWKTWLKSLNFWKITMMYTMARMYVNLSQVYTPLYLQNTLQMNKSTIAIIPFATYVSGFIFSFIARPVSTKLGSRSILLIGILFGIGSSIWIYFGSVYDDSYKLWQVYFVAAFIGIGGTALLISTLALTGDLIGNNTGTGAFVFAAMSFFDKNYNGIVIELFQHFIPKVKKVSDIMSEPVLYYKYVMIALTGGASIMVLLGFFAIFRSKYGRNSNKNINETSCAH